jgi:Prealbumin-like fold domain
VPTSVLAEPQTGIEGVITIAPAKPGPVRADAPGSVPLANATWVVKDDKGIVAKEFTTDDQGRFQTSLPSGRYTVSLKDKKTGVGRFGPFEVDVAAGQMTRVQWQCDSGIR